MFFITLATLNLNAIAQKKTDGIFLNIKFLPEKEYKIFTDTKNINESFIQGTEEYLNKLKSSGVEVYNISETKSSSITQFRSGKFNKDNTIPLDIEFEIVDSNENYKSSLKGLQNNTGQLEIHEINSEEVSEDELSYLQVTIQSMLYDYHIPPKTLKIGDTVHYSYKVTVPVDGTAIDIDMVINNVYTLTEIENDIATLEYTQNALLDFISQNESPRKGTGEGKGIIKYNTKTQFPEYSKIDVTVQTTVDAFPYSVLIKSRNLTYQTFKVANPALK